MNLSKKTALISTLLFGLISTSFANDVRSENFKSMTDEEKVNYLVQNPELLMEASKKFQEEQRNKALEGIKKQVEINKEQIANNPTTPFVGDKEANIVFVSFTDYNCVFCKKAEPIVEKLMNDNKDMKFVFKEFPIFQDRIAGSKYAALVGQKVFSEKGGEAYLKYHSILMKNPNTNEIAQVISAARQAGLELNEKLEGLGAQEVDAVNDNIDLAANKLSIEGTPAFIILNMNEPSKSEVVVGMESAEALQEKINKVK